MGIKALRGDNVLHAVAIRIRATGDGNLRTSLHSLQDVNNRTIDPIIMSASTNKLATKITNFLDQRIQLKITTTDIDETFTISRFYVFVKESTTGYPIT